MAALAPGEPARMYALCGVARCGATRCGYVSGKVFVRIGGEHYGFGGAADPPPGVKLGTLTITPVLDETPDTCQFRVVGALVPRGTEIVITLGTKNRYGRMFAGLALSVQQVYLGVPANLACDVHAVDYTWLLGFVKVTAQYTNASASAIASDLIARFAAANGFTAAAVVPNLPLLEAITFTNEDLTAALSRLARRVGAYWYVDYAKVVHLFVTETTNGDPEPLTPAHRSLDALRCARESAQVLTRVYVEGRGAALLAAVSAGDTMIPLESVAAFTAAADVFLKVSYAGAAGGAQHLNFAAVVPSTGGSLVGPGIAPPGALAAAIAQGAGLLGVYKYAYTFVTAAGETLPAPLATITVGGTIAPPAAAPALQPLMIAGALTPGSHTWAYTFTTAAGETTPSPITVAQSTTAPLTPTGGIWSLQKWMGGVLEAGKSYDYRVCYVGTGGGETTKAPAGNTTTIDSWGNNKPELFFGDPNGTSTWAQLPFGATHVKLYRTRGTTDIVGVSNHPHYLVATIPIQGSYPTASCNYMDTTPDAALGAAMPTVNTALVHAGVMRLSGLELAAGTTGRKIYRTAVGAAELRLVAAIGAATTYDDAIADGALGAVAPTVNTAGAEYRAVNLTAIAIGGAGVTGRKVYRTIGGGAQLKLLWHLTDNSTTVLFDQVTDPGLGANAPVSDTSGLTQPAGQVSAGATTIPVANPAAFQSGGGWAVIGNGDQVVRYTGLAAAAITGIPATGIGAITAAIVYNSTITTAPMLSGIPASGARAITRALVAGDEVYTVVQCDDPAAQAALAALVGGAGVREEWVQDRRLSVPEARARGAATLATRPLEEATLTYTCRDLRTAVGKVITVNLPAPTNLAGAFRIQQVTIANFRPHADQYPTFTVSASSAQFSFEDWLRRMVVRE